ncbi:MAG TPA: GNAT family N-acetyltransferase [Candidatus Diapherotrites archaeon]|uniref:GNAT family N-acetyltransferase n=1 Tax=Candidatus Iainarchaeum sp. TaxID=3101447 RepID=A0A7J4JVM8_9ARCH|nr:GNAT family N-acetyltransferase [Candidatus Diapherotrites archaeon]HIH33581.1 GNAT family N-acetyltransferase [Candidatus Diapherotrites archaeon]
MKKIILKTKRLVLRPVRKGDDKILFENVNDPLVTEFLPFEFSTFKKARDFVRRTIKEHGVKRFDFLSFLQNTGEFVGRASLHHFSKKDKRAEIGLFVARKNWKKGFGRELLEAILNFGFGKLELNRIGYHVSSKNKASLALVHSMHGKHEGTIREYYFRKGKFIDQNVFSILASEWKKRKRKGNA